jgi:hypothetical protein
MKLAGYIFVFVIVFAVAWAFFIPGFRTENGSSEENSLEPQAGAAAEPLLNLSSDREVYHSSEEMSLNATIRTPAETENLTIRIYGVKDKGGNFRINEERSVSVEPPGANEVFSFRMPSCYGCAGVSPGEYEIMMEVLRNGTIIGNCSKTVRLEK